MFIQVSGHVKTESMYETGPPVSVTQRSDTHRVLLSYKYTLGNRKHVKDPPAAGSMSYQHLSHKNILMFHRAVNRLRDAIRAKQILITPALSCLFKKTFV